MTEFSPDLASLLIDALGADGLVDLADSFRELKVHEPCSCGDEFCTSFYTGPRPDGPWGPGHRNLVYDFDPGMIVLDIVDDAIRFIEVLDRPDLGWRKAGSHPDA